MASSIPGVGRVTVSLRKSTMAFVSSGLRVRRTIIRMVTEGSKRVCVDHPTNPTEVEAKPVVSRGRLTRPSFAA
jgi:hypothetical protein